MLFTGPMVCSLLQKNGARKTKTRRLPGRLKRFGKITEFGPSDTAGYDWHFRDKNMLWHDLRHDDLLKMLPWRAGDRIWVKETWQAGMSDAGPCVACRADLHRWYPEFTGPDEGAGPSFNYDAHPTTSWDAGYWIGDVEAKGPWASPLHMPRWASRLTLTVKEIRIERLQDISEADAIAEGVFQSPGPLVYWGAEPDGPWSPTPISAYAALWSRINGEGSWQTNPFVIVIDFDVVEGNIDRIENRYEHACFICDKAFKQDDLCSMDINEGICHAACIEGSPIVDLDTGEPSEGPVDTFRYGDP